MTRILRNFVFTAFSDNCVAAKAMIPTVDALSPERRAYAGAGKS